MPAQPLVTVLISSYNDAALLPRTLHSILSQTLRDVELIVVDDGSTDDTWPYLIGLPDPRIVTIRNDVNRGLTWSLRMGVDRARGRYIARLDAGDFSHPKRLERQVAFLEQHPEIGILGCACGQTNLQGNSLRTLYFPESDLVIRWTSLIQNPFSHSAIIVRSDTLRRHGLNYDPTFQTTQDYDLWTRLLAYTQGASLRDKLTTILSRDGITHRH
jgi:glycosyltransferase involved in cell wall biosynthesis